MLITNFVALFGIVIMLSFLYQRYLEKQEQQNFWDNGEIHKYILKDKSLDKSKKPILWIHIPYEYNSRNWLSFGSRSSCELNQPYLYLTVKSIILKCDKSFKIVLIDDNTFEKLIPYWNVNINLLSDPMKSYIRQLAMAKLIYIYGGVNVPISFLCLRDLIDLYNKGVNNDTMFVCENYDLNITSTHKLFYPNSDFIGAPKNNELLKQFIHYMEKTITDDYTSQTKFLGDFDKWCNEKIHAGKIRLISGNKVGTKTIDDESVIVETLLGEDYINFYSKMYGIWIPDKMILKRNHYEWFARMSPEQIFQSQFILAKYIVLALTNTESLTNMDLNKDTVPDTGKLGKPDWVSFWKVPLTNGTLNIYGMKPQYLGNNIPRATNSGNLP
jgi:hypothetical protein